MNTRYNVLFALMTAIFLLIAFFEGKDFLWVWGIGVLFALLIPLSSFAYDHGKRNSLYSMMHEYNNLRDAGQYRSNQLSEEINQRYNHYFNQQKKWPHKFEHPPSETILNIYKRRFNDQ